VRAAVFTETAAGRAEMMCCNETGGDARGSRADASGCDVGSGWRSCDGLADKPSEDGMTGEQKCD